MDLLRLHTRGLKGFSHFPGDVALDFRTLPEGLVALVGDNGAGKTTLLESPLATLYGEFPSRPASSLLDSVNGKDAFLEVEVGFGARGTYRARVNVDGLRRATDAVLELTTPDGRRQTLNDGKVTTFTAAIARELPNLALVKASAFAAQSKTGSFSDLKPAARKDVFSSLLGLEVYERYEQTAREAVAVLDRRLDGQREVLARLQAETTPAHEDEFSVTGNALQVALGEAQYAKRDSFAAVEGLERAVEDQRTRAARYTAAIAELAPVQARRDDRVRARDQVAADAEVLQREATAELARMATDADRRVATHEAAIAALATVQVLDGQLRQRLDTIETALANKVHVREQKIANNKGLLDRAADIRAAARDLQTQQTAHATVAAQLDEARRVQREAQQLLTRARRDVSAIGDVDAALARARADAALIATVPFGEQCAAAGCQFVQQASQARDRVPGLEATVAQLQDRRRHESASALAAEAADIAVGGFEAALRDVTAEMGRLTPLAKDAVQLDAAQARVKELQDELDTLKTEAEQDRMTARRLREQTILDVGTSRTQHLKAIDQIRRDYVAAEEEATQRWEAKCAALADRATAVADQIVAIDEQLAALVAVAATSKDAHDVLLQTEQDLRTARAAQATAVHQLATVSQQCEAFEARRAAFLKTVAERDQLAAAVTALETERVEWAALARVFGRDGLPVLEIDAAGPSVSALANDLLQACFGGRFVIDIVTQQPKADGKGLKEVFEIHVHDSERGTEPDLSELSGGERVIVDEAIRSAIALLINQRNVTPLLTCWRDETVGALDPENAVRYVQMLRRIQQRGGFRRVLFISHNPEASALADAQIWIHDGQIETLLPPFSRSEAA